MPAPTEADAVEARSAVITRLYCRLKLLKRALDGGIIGNSRAGECAEICGAVRYSYSRRIGLAANRGNSICSGVGSISKRREIGINLIMCEG